jgi:general secretion pathway protein E
VTQRAATPPGNGLVQLLSLGGETQASEEEQKFLCYLSDGRLLIAAGQALNPHVLSYCARLDRLHRKYRPVPVDFAVLADAYGNARQRASGAGDHTKMQTAAKSLLQHACRERASDIHIRVKKEGAEIYFRVHNDLVRMGGHPREYGERLLATIYAAMTTVSDNSYKPHERQDASIGDRDKLPDGLYGVRVATAPTSEGSVMVLRLLYNDAGDDAELEPLGFSREQAAMMQRLKDEPIGMNIISGPTGSGKSTTLQRVLQGELAESRGAIHIITVEDPVEYPIAGAVQTPVTNAPTEEERVRMFSAAIANAMRLDPDTIMIGEVRDRASGQNALRAAMTGHQVWTTVHANGAIAIIDRLVDLGLPLVMVADHTITTGLISQRLIKMLCQHCRKPLSRHTHELNEGQLARVMAATGPDIGKVHLAGPGCPQCRQRGTIGRTAVVEIVMPDAKFFEYIRGGQKEAAKEYWLAELGGNTMLDHAVAKVAAGIVDPRMAERIVGPLVPPAAPKTRSLALVGNRQGV